jgi:hypothetical protein
MPPLCGKPTKTSWPFGSKLYRNPQFKNGEVAVEMSACSELDGERAKLLSKYLLRVKTRP